MENFEILEPYFVRLQVLAQVKSGDVVVLGDTGQWTLQPNSSIRSGAKKFLSWFTQTTIQPQRSAFLISAKETVRLLIAYANLLTKTSVFGRFVQRAKVSKEKEKEKEKENEKENDPKEKDLTSEEESECQWVLQVLLKIHLHLTDSLKGLEVLQKSEPYSVDLTWCSQLKVSVMDAISQFVSSLPLRLVGLDLSSLKPVSK